MPYKCRTCGTGNPDTYIVCNHPMCPDGRDQGTRPYEMAHNQQPPRPETSQPRWLNIFIAALVSAVVALTISMCSMARAMDHGFDPNSPITKWFEALKRPDFPSWSCCGKGDAYPVDRYWPNSDGTWTAVIADGSAIRFPDGTYRQYIQTGIEIIVPIGKINNMEDDLDNPTDRSWIFLRAATGEVQNIYCFVRHPSGN